MKNYCNFNELEYFNTKKNELKQGGPIQKFQ